MRGIGPLQEEIDGTVNGLIDDGKLTLKHLDNVSHTPVPV